MSAHVSGGRTRAVSAATKANNQPMPQRAGGSAPSRAPFDAEQLRAVLTSIAGKADALGRLIAQLESGAISKPDQAAMLTSAGISIATISTLAKDVCKADGASDVPTELSNVTPLFPACAALSEAQTRTVLETIASRMVVLHNLTLLAQRPGDDWASSVAADAAEALSASIGAMADVATGGNILGANRWHYGPCFDDEGKAGAA